MIKYTRVFFNLLLFIFISLSSKGQGQAPEIEGYKLLTKDSKDQIHKSDTLWVMNLITLHNTSGLTVQNDNATFDIVGKNAFNKDDLIFGPKVQLKKPGQLLTGFLGHTLSNISFNKSIFTQCWYEPHANENITIIHSTAESVDFTNKNDNVIPYLLHIEDSKISFLSLGFINFNSPPIFRRLSMDTLSIDNAILSCQVKFFDSPLPKAIYLIGLYAKTQSNIEKIDFTGFSNKKDTVCDLYLEESDVSRLELDYSNFKLKFSSDRLTDQEKENIYKQLLDEQKEDGFAEGYRKLSIDYAEFKYSKDKSIFAYIKMFFNRVWWDYGYDTSFIWKNSLIIFFIFCCINFLFYGRLLQEVYPIKEFSKTRFNLNKLYKNKLKLIIANFFYCLLYTGLIFWGVRLDFTKIKLQNVPLLTLIIIEYLCGIFCLAFIVHYVFS